MSTWFALVLGALLCVAIGISTGLDDLPVPVALWPAGAILSSGVTLGISAAVTDNSIGPIPWWTGWGLFGLGVTCFVVRAIRVIWRQP